MVLKLIVFIIALFIIFFSFFLDNEGEEFSPILESKENLSKTTRFTELTSAFRNIYVLVFFVFFVLVFLFKT